MVEKKAQAADPAVSVKQDPSLALAPKALGQASFFLHLHPPKVKISSLQIRTTWGLGMAALTLVFLLLTTGLALAFQYQPSPDKAYNSLHDFAALVPFGVWIRSLHRLASEGLLVVVLLHLGRVYLSAAFRGRRLLNWFVGLGLGLLVLALAFSGYVLPWDRRAYWAGTIGAQMLGLIPLFGSGLRALLFGTAEFGETALLRMYVFHVILLPLLGAVLVVMHLWRLRKDGGLAVPLQTASPGPVAMISSWPHLVLRESAWIAAVVAIFGWLAFLRPAALGQSAGAVLGKSAAFARSGALPELERAPWYFSGVQEMVSYSAFSGVVLFPAALFLALVLLPVLARKEGALSSSSLFTRWPGDLAALLTGLVVGVLGLVMWEQQRTLGGMSDPAALVVWAGFIIAGLTGLFAHSWRLAGRRLALHLLAAYLLLTWVVLYCRGPSWTFIAPWSTGAGL